MSISMLLLTIMAIFVYCGLLQRVLDRMRLTDRQAILIIAAMLAGSFLPDISLGMVQINIGGAVIPALVCVYLAAHAEKHERLRAVIGSILTCFAVLVIARVVPAEPEAMQVDPIWFYAIAGGSVAWLLGRSRRNAFICSFAGIILADIATGVLNYMQGNGAVVMLGGAGIADAAVIGAVIGVLFCELAGETMERLSRMKTGGNH